MNQLSEVYATKLNSKINMLVTLTGSSQSNIGDPLRIARAMDTVVGA
jgi:hypothetical protein